MKQQWRLIPGKRLVATPAHVKVPPSKNLELQAQQLENDGIQAQKSDYVAVLQSCNNPNSLSIGRRLHRLLHSRGLLQDVFLANHLVNMYSRCDSILEAEQLFSSISPKNVVSWNIMISGYVLHRRPSRAMQLFNEMNVEGVRPTSVTYIAVAGACSAIGDPDRARRIHTRITGEVRELSVVLNTALITMYGRCGAVDDARRVFSSMRARNDVSWNAMICAYSQHGFGREALELFDEMEFAPTEATFVSALEACGSIGDFTRGQEIHSRITSMCSSTDSPEILNTALVNMYAKCGKLSEARKVFDNTSRGDVVAWTAMIVACVQHGEAGASLNLFWRMEQEGIRADKILLVSLLDACSCLGDLAQAKRMHQRVEAEGLAGEDSVASGLVNMYRKCGSLGEARSIFIRQSSPDQLSWNSMIAGYSELGSSSEAIFTMKLMDQAGVRPDSVTFNSALGACSSARFLSQGKALHERCVSSSCIDENLVGVSLVKMYGDCGFLPDAKVVFDRLSSRDVVAWSALIGAYAQHGNREALECWRMMEEEGVEANNITFISLLDACANSGELALGQEIHTKVAAAGYDSQVVVATALVNMYGKCGELTSARKIFDRIHPRDVVAWTSMITAYVLHGFNREALELYVKLEPEGMKPDKVVYLSVLEACSNLTALELGRAVHRSIVSSGLGSDLGLSNSLVNLYAKCGSLSSARELFDGMRHRDLVSWNTMITSYGHHGGEETALEVYKLMKLDGMLPNDITFVSVLFVCSHAGLLEEGCRCFASITRDYSMELSLEHYCCVIDLLGRLGNLDEADALIGDMSEPCTVVWMSLLAACKTHGDAERALRVAGLISELDPGSFAGEVLLSNIYAAAGWDEARDLNS